MTRTAALPAAALALALAAAACAESTPSYPAECAAACTAPAGPCSGADEDACRAACVSGTAGLAAACAGCVLQASGWTGMACSCDGAGSCWPCAFGPGPHTCRVGPGGTCGASDESCGAFELGRPDGSACAAACGAAAP
ncbi:MAG TPA: hypothetical protein VGQ83_31995 [Polyangia bacterium]|jgi:hypothetical protein